MSFSLNVSLKDAKIIQGDTVYLELLIDDNDHKNLLDLFEKNYENDYIKTLYAERPEYVHMSMTRFQVSTKIERNKNYPEETKTFTKLYYAIKLKSDDVIIGTFEMYSSRDGIELGMFIDQAHSHQGYGSSVLNIAIEFLKKNSSVKKLIWECDAINEGSVGVAKKCGFVHLSDSKIYEGRMASKFCLEL